MNATITEVRNGVFRINHPQTNAALTRSGGSGSPKLHTRLINALVKKYPHLENVSEQCGINLAFRKGNNSTKWYFEMEPHA